jgi:hypothetical protein
MSVIRILTAGSLAALVGGAIPGAAVAAAADTLPKLAAPKAPEAETPPPIPASTEAGAVWYVVIDGVKVGPLTDAALLKRMDRGEIGTETLVWRAGMADWQTIAATETIMAKRVAAALKDYKRKTPLDEKFGRAV